MTIDEIMEADVFALQGFLEDSGVTCEDTESDGIHTVRVSKDGWQMECHSDSIWAAFAGATVAFMVAVQGLE